MPPGKFTQFLIVAVFTLLVRLSYLDHPIQGDDYYYLSGAMHGQIDPAHPHQARYIFQGREVWMLGHPHPPLNSWILTAILAVAGDIRAETFHGVYVVLSLLVAVSVFALARRYSPHPALATLLVVAAPAFLVSGNSLESDLPFLAFWTAGIAAFVSGRLWIAVPMLTAAGLAAYQSVVVIPILWMWLWLEDRGWAAGWLASLTPAFALVCWQIFERWSAGVYPLAVTSTYFAEYGLQKSEAKWLNAEALSGHALFVVGPVLLIALLLLRRGRLQPWERRDTWLLAWIGIFFAAALALFFAGSARYLLPLTPAAALLVTRQLGAYPRVLMAGVALQMVLGFALARANFEHWRGYQQFVERLKPEIKSRRVWINGEWGLRYYAEAEGALPLEQGQALRPGDVVVTSKLSYPISFTTGGGTLAPLAELTIRPQVPLRLIGVGSRSAWSTVSKNARWPFEVSDAPVDIVTAEVVVEREPTLSYLPMSAPEADSQIVSGLYQLENGRYRWMAGQATILLKSPSKPTPLQAVVYLPDMAPAREVRLELDGREVARQTYQGAGLYTITTPPLEATPGRTPVSIKVDQTFVAPGDTRRLGIILQEIGFR